MISQQNSGIWYSGFAPAGPQMTVAATGLGRSGTTMVARVLGNLGLYMGTHLSPRTSEDMEIRSLVKQADSVGFERACRERDLLNERWGFKSPAFRSRIISYGGLMRNPRLIVTFRDVLAISIRNNLALEVAVVASMRRALRSYNDMLRQIVECGYPVLMISYEKALQFPDDMVREISDFCGLSPTPEMLLDAASIVRNGDKLYLADAEPAQGFPDSGPTAIAGSS